MPRRVHRGPISAFKGQVQVFRVVVEWLAPDQQRVEYHAHAVDVRRLRQGLNGGWGIREQRLKRRECNLKFRAYNEIATPQRFVGGRASQ